MLIKEMSRQKNKTISADRHCHDVCQAMRDLQEEQGFGTVIFSNQKINGGVEIIAAPDYEDSLVCEEDGSSLIHSAGSSDFDPGNIENEVKGLRNIMQAPMMQFDWGKITWAIPLYVSLLKQLMTLGLSVQQSNKLLSDEQLAYMFGGMVNDANI